MKKSNIFLLATAILIIAAYLVVRFFLQADIRSSRTKTGDTAALSDRNPDSTVDLRPLFIAKIQQVVKEGSKGLYSVSIDSMVIDVLQSMVVLHHVDLKHDSAILSSLDSTDLAPDQVFNASFDTLKINGINLDDVLTRKTIDFREVIITGPTIEVYTQNRSSNRKKVVDSITLFDRIMKDMDRIAVDKMVIQKARFISHNRDKNKKNVLNDVQMTFNNILIDSTTEHEKNRFLFARQAFLSIKNYTLKTKDDIYQLKIGGLTVEAPEQNMTIHDLSLVSRYDKQQFKEKSVHQKEQYTVNVPKISIQGIDWWAIMHQDLFVARKVIVPGGYVKIYLDRSLPRPKSKMGKFPHQLITKLPIQILVSSMDIRNLDMTYEEYNPKSKMAGSIHLSKVNLDLSAITNIPAEMKRKKQTSVIGTALFKHVPVSARFNFDLLHSRAGKFSASLSTGGFEGVIMNDIAESLGLLKVEKGRVNKLRISMQGDERQASGSVLLLYNDFKISMYEKENDEKGLDKKGLIGFFANTFVVKDDNPARNKPPRISSSSFQRDPQTGFFNLVWKTALSGILKTIGANPKLAEKK